MPEPRIDRVALAVMAGVQVLKYLVVGTVIIVLGVVALPNIVGKVAGKGTEVDVSLIADVNLAWALAATATSGALLRWNFRLRTRIKSSHVDLEAMQPPLDGS